jgi:hypothetical protein
MLSSNLANSGIFLFMVEFQWFLMVLSVRPGISWVIMAHLLPSTVCARKSTHSSELDHWFLLMLGLRWLNHLSRHCLPIRPGTCFDITDQRCAPNLSTNLISNRSYSSVQDFFLLFSSLWGCWRCEDGIRAPSVLEINFLAQTRLWLVVVVICLTIWNFKQ